MVGIGADGIGKVRHYILNAMYRCLQHDKKIVSRESGLLPLFTYALFEHIDLTWCAQDSWGQVRFALQWLGKDTGVKGQI